MEEGGMNARRIQQLAAAFLVGITLTAWMQAPQAKEDPKARLAKAEAMFAERCKKAGVFIHRTAENVEGVFLMKLRPKGINYRDQYRLDDPYGRVFIGDGYIESFLWGRNEKGALDNTKSGGYRYVEAIDEKDGKRYRYTGSLKAVRRMDVTAKGVQMALARNPNYDLNIYDFVLDKVPAPGPASRYSVTYDDISTREERDYWIAGSLLKVIDLQTNEVMAERIGYMMDRGQGNTGGGRSPWLFAADNACPVFGPEKVGLSRSFHQPSQTRNFVEQVLHIAREK
jgi:hypothetical protein